MIGPMLQDVLRTGKATSPTTCCCFWSGTDIPKRPTILSYSPILDESGGIGGVFTAVTLQTTDKVIGERRLRTLRDVAARSADAASESEAWCSVAEVLRDNPYDVQFAVLYRFDPQREVAEPVAFAGIEPQHPFLLDLITLRNEGSDVGCASYVGKR